MIKPYFKTKVALMIAYNGSCYHGLQYQPSYPTIESVIYQALIQAVQSLVSKLNSDDIRKIGITRGARTDKGVHALCNILSLKLQIGDQFCPSMKGDKLVDKWNIDWDSVIHCINSELPSDIIVHGIKHATQAFNVQYQAESRIYSYISPQFISNELKLQEICHHFLGTNNYHNYTSSKAFKDPSSQRFIKSFTVNSYAQNGQQYHKFQIHGNSFMYHQIRKIIGTVYQTIKEDKPLSFIKQTFSPEKQSLYVAPQNGLYLSEIKFDGYNLKEDIPEKIEISPKQQLIIDKFQEDLIKSICEEYERSNVFQEWYNEILLHQQNLN